MARQPGFHYFSCPHCGFSSVQNSAYRGSENCPLCYRESGADCPMSRRRARPMDTPSGHDARLSASTELPAALA